MKRLLEYVLREKWLISETSRTLLNECGTNITKIGICYSLPVPQLPCNCLMAGYIIRALMLILEIIGKERFEEMRVVNRGIEVINESDGIKASWVIPGSLDVQIAVSRNAVPRDTCWLTVNNGALLFNKLSTAVSEYKDQDEALNMCISKVMGG